VTETEINLPVITADVCGLKHLQMKLTRAQLEPLSEGLMARLRGPFEAALKDAGLPASEVDEVILVGGATRMPMVQELVRSLTGKETIRASTRTRSWRSGQPSRPACWWGSEGRPPAGRHAALAGRGNHGRGQDNADPAHHDGPFREAQAVLQCGGPPEDGRHPRAAGGEIYGGGQDEPGAVLTGRDPPAPRGVPQIELTFEVDGNGILHVTAKDLASDREHAVTIPASTNLTSQVHRAHGRRGEATRGRELPAERGGGRPQPRRFVVLSGREGDARAGGKVPAADRCGIEEKIAERGRPSRARTWPGFEASPKKCDRPAAPVASRCTPTKVGRRARMAPAGVVRAS